MALKPTIYKLKLALSDLDRGVYESLHLTVARHPSETLERMMVRILAFSLNAREQLTFCKGLSDTEEPDIWRHSLDGTLELWIDVGEPAPERIKKATRLAAEVKVYCFNHKASTWWELNRKAFAALPASVIQFQWPEIQALAKLMDRTLDASVTIIDGAIYVATESGECELATSQLQ